MSGSKNEEELQNEPIRSTRGLTRKGLRSIKWGKKESREKGDQEEEDSGNWNHTGMKCNTYHLEERKEEERDRKFGFVVSWQSSFERDSS